MPKIKKKKRVGQTEENFLKTDNVGVGMVGGRFNPQLAKIKAKKKK